MQLHVELEQEVDGRWIAAVPMLPGVLAYGKTQDQALCRVKSLALRVIADRIDHGEEVPPVADAFVVPS